MKLILQDYGKILSSRPAGREAALAALAYTKDLKAAKEISIDFEGVRVMTPSWLGEFIETLRDRGITNFKFLNTSNPTVHESIEVLELE